jgi:hypothetical protein
MGHLLSKRRSGQPKSDTTTGTALRREFRSKSLSLSGSSSSSRVKRHNGHTHTEVPARYVRTVCMTFTHACMLNQ